MDGYAVRAADTTGAAVESPVSLQVVADIAAGTPSDRALTPGTAARIMTGAPMPAGADAVVPVEDTDEPWRGAERPLPERIAVRRGVNAGDYVRGPGEDIRAGTTVLEAGHAIRAQEVGVLASMGFVAVPVIRRPRVGILATGDELVDVDQPLGPGKIRNSNSYAQAAQVLALGGEPVMLGIAGDRLEDVRERLHAGLAHGIDLFVSSAGVSVGAYDVVKVVLEEEGEILFWRVRMRPGKPLTFAAYHGIPYLGLPGNPVSAMVSFERFARPAILKLAGQRDLHRPTVKVVLSESITSDGRESYIRAIVRRDGEGYEAATTGSQGSHILTSMARANALLLVPEGVKEVPAGTTLTAVMIDWPATVF
jgi:molybdopterin molybdotransferase